MMRSPNFIGFAVALVAALALIAGRKAGWW